MTPLDVDRDGRLLTGVSDWLPDGSSFIPSLGIVVDDTVVWGLRQPPRKRGGPSQVTLASSLVSIGAGDQMRNAIGRWQVSP